MDYTDTEFQYRFWSKVTKGEPDECWEWIASRGEGGYGRLRVQGRTVRAHRLALEITLGRALNEGMETLHTCDNPPCCNPRHLREDTHKKNMDEARERGLWAPPYRTPEGDEKHKERTPRGDRHWTKTRPGHFGTEANPKRKLTQEAVDEIRRLRAEEGLTYRQLADRFSVTEPLIGNIIRLEIWAEGSRERRENRPQFKPAEPKGPPRYPKKAHGGSDNANAKLTWEQVREIRQRAQELGVKPVDLALQFGVSAPSIRNIIAGRTYRETDSL